MLSSVPSACPVISHQLCVLLQLLIRAHIALISQSVIHAENYLIVFCKLTVDNCILSVYSSCIISFSGHEEGFQMKSRWKDWVVTAVVCIVFPPVLPMMLLAVLVLSVTNAFKRTPGDDYVGRRW